MIPWILFLLHQSILYSLFSLFFWLYLSTSRSLEALRNWIFEEEEEEKKAEKNLILGDDSGGGKHTRNKNDPILSIYQSIKLNDQIHQIYRINIEQRVWEWSRTRRPHRVSLSLKLNTRLNRLKWLNRILDEVGYDSVVCVLPNSSSIAITMYSW